MLISNGRCLVSDLTWVTDNYLPNIKISYQADKVNDCDSILVKKLSIFKKEWQALTDKPDVDFSVNKCFDKVQCNIINDLLISNDITPFNFDFLSTADQGKFFVHDLKKGIFCCVINFPFFHVNDVLLSALTVSEKRNGNGSRVIKQISSLIPVGASIYAFTENKENNYFYLANRFISIDFITAAYLQRR